MLTLYGAPSSVFVRKPRILLQEKQVAFVCDPVDLYVVTHDAFCQASPLNKIPALRDDHFTLSDSSAICAYIEKKYPYPRFYPQSPEEYGQALWYEEYADTVLFQALAPFYYQTVLVPLYHHQSPDMSAINRALTLQLPPVADYLDTQVRHKHFLVGEQLTIADVAVVSMFMNMHFINYPLDSKNWPHLSKYLDAHFQRESFVSCQQDINKMVLQLTEKTA